MKTFYFNIMRVDERLEHCWYGRPYIHIFWNDKNTLLELRCFEKDGKYWTSIPIYTQVIT